MKKILWCFLSLFLIKGFLMAVELKSLQVKGAEIPILYEKNSQLPLFFVQIVFKGAGGINNQKNYGLSDITSSLLNEGTQKLGAIKFAQKLEEKALNLSVGSGLETMSFTLSGMSKEQKVGFKYLKELIENPNFTDKALEKVKENSLIGILEKENDFDYQANRALSAMLFQGSPLEYPLSGTKDSIAKMSLGEIQKFYQSYVNLESAILIVGGDVEYAEITKELAELLEILPVGKAVDIKEIKANEIPQTKRQIKETKQAYIYFGAPLEVRDLQKESAMIKVASFVLGGSGFGSRMMEEVRVKRGLAYSAVMRLEAGKTLSYAKGYLQTSLKNEKDAQKLVQQVVDEFVKNGITEQELQEAKQYLLGSEPLRNETLSQRLGNAFSNYYKGLPLDFNAQILKDIQNLTLEQVNHYIQSHKEITKLTFSVVSAD